MNVCDVCAEMGTANCKHCEYGNPCLGCADYSEETDTCKSHGGCGAKDVAPVMHAHVVWTKQNGSYQTQCCSNCHRTFISRPDEAIEFCPHCGAKMVEYPESGEGDNYDND